MSTSTLLTVFLIEGAVFGILVAVGYPRFGPQRITSALVAVAVAFAALWVVPAAIHLAAANIVLLRVVLAVVLVPTLAGLFWASSCFLRALVRMLTPLAPRF